MRNDSEVKYEAIRSGGMGLYEHNRGIIAVWGKEAVQFLDGLVSNNMKTLEDGAQMTAAFPNAQGRLLAVVRILRQADRFFVDTEEATREKVFQNLFRFTFAGDFFVEDLSENYRNISIFGKERFLTDQPVIEFRSASSADYLVPVDDAAEFLTELQNAGAVTISDELYEVLRIENGVPIYGVDMDETTIVPELGIDGLISYNKGCYIGQEIIARIHFRGHVAKRLTGLIFLDHKAESLGSVSSDVKGAELTTPDAKNAGHITTAAYSPKLGKMIALAFVRYAYLAEGTELKVGDKMARVAALPFISLSREDKTHA